jgi:hypothetical protein
VIPKNFDAAKAVHRNSSKNNIISGDPNAPAQENYHLHEEGNI